MPKYKFVQVAVNLPLNDVFDYSVPEDFQDKVEVGKRVWVPFGKRTIVGFIVRLSNTTDIAKTRKIKSVIDEQPILSDKTLKLCRWIADYYLCSLGEAIEAAIAMPFKKGKTEVKPRKNSQKPLPGIELFSNPKNNILNEHQKKALSQINSHIGKNGFGVFLLHGITASGKTEVYFEAIKQSLAQDKDVLVFIPEIALTPQTLQRFSEKFSHEKVAVIHSRLSAGEKYVQWQKIKQGQAKIVVGPRSAIFSPIKDLGLIVIDEEHENSYKQEDVPRYHLVDTAIKLAQLSDATVILGSATPSLESSYRARRKELKFIDLPERIEGMNLPEVQLVDMKTQSSKSRRTPVISKPLEDNIAKCLKNYKQVILFLNRRGFSTFINCTKCGYVLNCPKCNLALVYHYDKKQLVCHHCGYKQASVSICPECNGDYISYLGKGTQKVESELARLFPKARIARMDSDSVKKKTAHFEILEKFRLKKIDILIGTQMIAKGLDFPEVNLVGVISADVSLNLPDFRASERTFSLLTQVAGRTGRSREKGKVIIQTYTPDHYAVQCAISHDYDSFYEQEIGFRKQLDLPPFTHIINLVLRSKNEKAVFQAAGRLFEKIQEKTKGLNINIIGPTAMPIAKLRDHFRCGIIIKTQDVLNTNKALKDILRNNRATGNIKLAVDVDPMMML
jgi:primosomal protein N' (replication factor Y)